MDSRGLQGPKNTHVWDCGSSLYDSFELKSFKKQLDAAITSRCHSMPRISDRTPPPPPPAASAAPRKPSKIARSLRRFLRSVFRLKLPYNKPFRVTRRPMEDHDKQYYFYSSETWPGVLETIPETPEKAADQSPPELGDAVVRKTQSERFTSATAGGGTKGWMTAEGKIPFMVL